MKTFHATIMTKGRQFGWVANHNGELHGALVGHSREFAQEHCRRWAERRGAQVEFYGEMRFEDLVTYKWMFGK